MAEGVTDDATVLDLGTELEAEEEENVETEGHCEQPVVRPKQRVVSPPPRRQAGKTGFIGD